MIDIENELYTMVATAVRAEYPSVYFTGVNVKTPPSIPCVEFVERDNTPVIETQTQDDMENHVSVMYEVNVYSNKAEGKKAECKAIMAIIDNTMLGIGFNRTFKDSVPNLNDATIYRITARYQAVIGKDKTIYRR